MGLANTGGWPVKVLTETDVIKLEALACVLTESQVVDYFGMTEKTLRAIGKSTIAKGFSSSGVP